MRRKYIIIVLIIQCIGIINIFENVKGSVVPKPLFFDTDKNSYYIDEDIKINASWELDYINQSEISFVQVRIYHENDTLLWNSPEYHEIGTFQKSWIVQISDLNIFLENSSIELSVQFYLYYWDLSYDIWQKAIDEKSIWVNKRDISCQLIGFPSVIKYKDNLSFQARFYDTYLNSSSYLIDQIIECKVISTDLCWLNQNFTVNSTGIIEVNINLSNISENQNFLIFSIKDNEYYCDREFEYIIILEGDQVNNIPGSPVIFDFLPFIPIPIILLISITIVFLNKNKKTKHRKLIDITIKY